VRFLILIPLALFGAYQFIREVRLLKAGQDLSTRVGKLRRARILCVPIGVGAAVATLPVAAVGGPPWALLVCFAIVALSMVALLVLSVLVGFAEGLEQRWHQGTGER
jgi:hypothetical protein